MVMKTNMIWSVLCRWIWILQDLLGVAFCLNFLKTITLSNFKVTHVFTHTCSDAADSLTCISMVSVDLCNSAEFAARVRCLLCLHHTVLHTCEYLTRHSHC